MEAIDKFVTVNQLLENEVTLLQTHSNKLRLFFDRSRMPMPNYDVYYDAGGENFIYPLGLTSKDFSTIQEEFNNEPD